MSVSVWPDKEGLAPVVEPRDYLNLTPQGGSCLALLAASRARDRNLLALLGAFGAFNPDKATHETRIVTPFGLPWQRFRRT